MKVVFVTYRALTEFLNGALIPSNEIILSVEMESKYLPHVKDTCSIRGLNYGILSVHYVYEEPDFIPLVYIGCKLYNYGVTQKELILDEFQR